MLKKLPVVLLTFVAVTLFACSSETETQTEPNSTSSSMGSLPEKGFDAKSITTTPETDKTDTGKTDDEVVDVPVVSPDSYGEGLILPQGINDPKELITLLDSYGQVVEVSIPFDEGDFLEVALFYPNGDAITTTTYLEDNNYSYVSMLLNGITYEKQFGEWSIVSNPEIPFTLSNFLFSSSSQNVSEFKETTTGYQFVASGVTIDIKVDQNRKLVEINEQFDSAFLPTNYFFSYPTDVSPLTIPPVAK